ALFGFGGAGLFSFLAGPDGEIAIGSGLAPTSHGQAKSNDQRQGNGAGGGEGDFVAAKRFLDFVAGAGRARDDGFVVEMAFEVGSKTVGRFVTAGAIFLQTFHD